MKQTGWRRLAILTGVTLLLLACSQKVSLEHFNRLRVGQSYDEVKQIIGDPARCDETLGVRTCVWGNQERGIRIAFLGDAVVLLSAHNLN